MESNVMLAARLEQAIGPLNVGVHEWLRVGDRAIVMALRRKVHDRIVAGDDAIQQLGIADVAHHEFHAALGQARDVLGVAGVGKLVQHSYVHAGMLADHPPHEVGPDEAAATGDDDVSGLEGIGHCGPPYYG